MGAAARATLALTPGSGVAAAYGTRLLATLGVASPAPLAAPDEHPALAWAGSGLMALTGAPGGEPQMCPAPIAACADGALTALAALGPAGALDGLRGAELLGERAALSGHTRNGAISPGGSCRLLEAADGALALNLARDEDWLLLPAWLERDGLADWEAVARALRERPVAELVERGRLLGLAVAADEMPEAEPVSWFSTTVSSPRRRGSHFRSASADPPWVVDLSSLWAGPLCGHLLQRLGARVIKVESTARPDGARRGPGAFHDLLNAGKASVALDFATAEGRAQLQALLRRADIVIEGSRPRALRQLGIDAQALVRERPGMTWIAISGYGRGEPAEHWVAYGDDAGVAAGLSRVLREASGLRLFAGDAIADPLTGLHAALAAWAGFRAGGAGLVSLALREVVRHCLAFDTPPAPDALRARQRDWSGVLRASGRTAARPRMRAPPAPARPLGADTAAVLRDLA